MNPDSFTCFISNWVLYYSTALLFMRFILSLDGHCVTDRKTDSILHGGCTVLLFIYAQETAPFLSVNCMNLIRGVPTSDQTDIPLIL